MVNSRVFAIGGQDIQDEKETSKNNELDIEVSKEFLNKFRKSRKAITLRM